jgi:hypothetical protein
MGIAASHAAEWIARMRNQPVLQVAEALGFTIAHAVDGGKLNVRAREWCQRWLGLDGAAPSSSTMRRPAAPTEAHDRRASGRAHRLSSRP